MIPYWLMFFIPAFATLFEKPGRLFSDRRGRTLFVVFSFMLCLMIGLRYQVGGDWGQYLRHLAKASYTEFSEIAGSGDPGYVLLNWIVARLGGDIWLVNLACAALFTYGLSSFALAQPRPWLALAIAVPYLIVVVAMGYTRQGVAIGLAMRGLVSLGSHRSNVKFVFWVIAAAAFHKSAVLLIPIAALAESRGRLWTMMWVGGATVVAYYALLEESVDRLMYGYVEAEYDSAGALIRIVMNALPALLLILFRKRIPLRPKERSLWVILALIALVLVPLVIISPSSTAVDRMGLYLIPLQLVVLSRLPDTFFLSRNSYKLIDVIILIYSGAVLFVWLNYASHASLWLPYRIYPLLT